MIKNFSGQGTIEYLVIVGVVITVALIVTSVVIMSVGDPVAVDFTSQQIGLQSALLGINDIVSNSNGDVALDLKNNDFSAIKITRIELDGIGEVFNKMLFLNEEQTFVVRTGVPCVSNKKSFAIKINYTTSDGLEKVKNVDRLSVTCSEYSVVKPLGLSKYKYFWGEFSCPVGLLCNSSFSANFAKKSSAIRVTTDEEYTVYTFDYDGSDKVFIPDFNGTILVKLWGAGGGGGNRGGWSVGSAGGGGGYTSGNINVTSGEEITLIVGEGGLQGTAESMLPSYGGGGRSCNTGSDCRYGGAGGGMSAIKINDNYLAIAGGGGGGGSSKSSNYSMSGGAGGGSSGVDGSSGYSSAPNAKGKGGTQSAGGAGGTGTGANGNAGTQYLGGSPASNAYGGAGGGGYFGGGGGAYQESYTMGGGGGGSGYASSGFTTIAGSGMTPANSSDADRGTAGNGGAESSNGTNGRIVIRFLTSLGSAKTGTNSLYNISFNGELDLNTLANYTYLSSDYNRDMNGLVGYYKFNELNSSGALIDYAGYDNNLTAYNGGTIAKEGMWGTRAGYFNAEGHYRSSLTSEFDFLKANSFSACSWIYPKSNNLSGRLISRMATTPRGWELYVESGKYLGANIIYSWASDALAKYTTNVVIEPYQWQHVCFTYDGSVSINGLKIYYNGELQETTNVATSLTTEITNTSNFSIGSRNGTLVFHGYIDEAKIWNRNLSAEEIANDYNGWQTKSRFVSQVIDLNESNPIVTGILFNKTGPVFGGEINPELDEKTSQGLIGLWHLNENNNNTFLDFSGEGNDAIVPKSEEVEEAYTIHTFKSNGTFTPSTDMNVEVLVVGGGGAGGTDAGGGGGAGGVVYEESHSLTNTTYDITVGAGGKGGPAGTPPTSGKNSTFDTITAIGGGYGAYYPGNRAADGGSGGGNQSCCGSPGAGNGTPGQGNAGSSSSGGGGAGAAGNGCVGGEGLFFSQFANAGGNPSGWFGGGGSGGCSFEGVAGGGGTGGNGEINLEPTCHGIANTGGGGGGGSGGGPGAYGCNGGSGIVIIKYLNSSGSATSTNAAISDSTPIDHTPLRADGLWGTNTLEFNGTSSYIEVKNNEEFNDQSEFTISQWIYFEEYANSMVTISKDGSSGFYLKIGNGSLNNGQLYARYGTAAGVIGSVGEISANKWHHLAVTYSTGNLYGYLDGVVIGRLSGNAPSGMNDNLFIGAYASNNSATPDSFYFDGKIEETAIWNRTLTPDEIKTIFTIGAADLGLQYRICDDANCDSEEWSSVNYNQVEEIPISQANKYFQWAIKPTFVNFFESAKAGCYAQSAALNDCTDFSSEEECLAENSWNSECSWGEGEYYCKDDPNIGYVDCYLYYGNPSECMLRAPTCQGYGYCNYNLDDYDCSYLPYPDCLTNPGCYDTGYSCSGYAYEGCYYYANGESSCNSMYGCHWYWDDYCYQNTNCPSMTTQEQSLCDSTYGCYWGVDTVCEAATGITLPCSMAQSSTTCNYLSGCAFRTTQKEGYTTRPNVAPILKDINLFYYI